MASTYLTRTPSSSGNRNKWTLSGWVKRSQTSAEEVMFSAYQSNDYYTFLRFEADGTIKFRDNYTGSANLNLDTNAIYRDTSAWYHVVAVYDKDNATSADKAILYINGERVTSFSTATYPSNASTWNVDNVQKQIGSLNTGQYWNGSMSHIHFSDGYALAPTVFGETDATTGEWKIKTDPSFTLGTNGFTILKDGNTITDQSSNSNNWSLGAGTLTNTEDCPDNVFATLNNLDNYYSNFNLFDGNTSVGAGNGPRTYLLSTMGCAPTGKYYWEIKLLGEQNQSESTSVMFGISRKTTASSTEDLTDGVASSCIINGNGQVYVEGTSAGTFGSSYLNTTVMCFAYDAINNKMYFGKDGTWLNSGDPTSGATGTGAFIPTALDGSHNNIYSPCWGVNYNSGYSSAFNFGNGYFNKTAVASAGINASGNGIFEHDVPTGYTALSTKGLNL